MVDLAAPRPEEIRNTPYATGSESFTLPHSYKTGIEIALGQQELIVQECEEPRDQRAVGTGYHGRRRVVQVG